MAAAYNPWTYMQFAGKITGQDIVNKDMLWNRTHLGWWQDGYYADYGSWRADDGTDSFWQLQQATTIYNTSQHLVNNYNVYHDRAFHSDGFPYSFLPDVNAWTTVSLWGYYNGYALCNFSHNYDSGANYYPNLHWRDDCYWE